MYQIEAIAPLPSDQTGYAVTFSGISFTNGQISAIGRLKGLYYRGLRSANKTPRIHFSVRLDPEDPGTLHFACEGRTNVSLMQGELLQLLQGIEFVSQDLKKLPFVKPQSLRLRDTKGHFLSATQPATAG